MTGDQVSTLAAAVSSLAGLDLSALPATDVVDLLEQLETASRQLDAVAVRVTAEVESRRVSGDYGATSTADLLTRRLRLSPGAARARVERAAELMPRTALTGEVLEPLLPGLALACTEGAVSMEHAAAVSRGLDALPCTLSAEQFRVAEDLLVTTARHEHPGTVAKVAALLKARLDQDGPPPEPDAIRRDRTLRLHRRGDGTSRISGLLTVEATAMLTAVLDSLAAPAPGWPTDAAAAPVIDGRRPATSDGDPAGDATPDPRTAAQRNHDAFCEMLRRLLGSGTLPRTGGIPVTVLVRARAEDLAAGRGVALTDRGHPWRIADLLGAAGDATVTPVFLDRRGAVTAVGGPPGSRQAQPLWLDRTVRLATHAQRQALAVRDGGCAFPGCERPASWCEVHHVTRWEHGGRTDIDQMVLLCRAHHRGIDTSPWTLRMTHGVPEWIPPPWIDPHQRPRRNHAHHPTDLLGHWPDPAPPAPDPAPGPPGQPVPPDPALAPPGQPVPTAHPSPAARTVSASFSAPCRPVPGGRR